jgi:hypothetical protein
MDHRRTGSKQPAAKVSTGWHLRSENEVADTAALLMSADQLLALGTTAKPAPPDLLDTWTHWHVRFSLRDAERVIIRNAERGSNAVKSAPEKSALLALPVQAA